MKALPWLASALVLCSIVGCGKKKVASTEPEPETTKTDTKSSEPGVTADSLTLAMPGTFTGNQAGYGIETWRGAEAYFREVNANGGVHGRKIVLQSFDDGSAQEKTKDVVDEAFKADPFALFSTVGAGVNQSIVSVLQEDKLRFVFGTFGGPGVRPPNPISAQFFHTRASFKMEGTELADALANAGLKKICQLLRDDVYGKAVSSGIEPGLKKHSLAVVETATHEKDMKYGEPMTTQVSKLRASQCDVVILGTTYAQAAAFVRDARMAGWDVPVASNSVTVDTMLRMLLQAEKATSKKLATKIIYTSVVPGLDTTGALVTEFKSLMDKRNPQLPEAKRDPNYRNLPESYAGLEGFLNAKVFIEIAKRVGGDLTRAKFVDVAEQLTGFDPGVGDTISYARGNHEGLHKAWFLGVVDGKVASINDIKVYLNTTAAGAKPSAKK